MCNKTGGVGRCPLLGSKFVLKRPSQELSCCPEQRSGHFWEVTFLRCHMLKLIGGLVIVRLREAVRFWEGPLREAPLHKMYAISYFRDSTDVCKSAN